jgi:hypothetical protein
LLLFLLLLKEGVSKAFAASFASSLFLVLAGVFASDAGGGGGGARRVRERGRPDAPGRVGAFAGRGFGSATSGSSSVDERGRLSLLRRVTMDLGAEDVVVTCGSGNAEEESASPGRGSRDADRCISSSGRSKQRGRVV